MSTTDFFPPLVDDPADFGAIAAANACSDVFAMGGRVVLALNIAAFPEDFPTEAIAAILAAAAGVVRDAGGTVAGGHTIRSEEPIFGLAVQGLVHPDRVWSKAGARPGDRLVLSKPLGSGIVLAGGQRRRQGGRHRDHAHAQPDAAADLTALPDRHGRPAPHAVTDVTGFGLAGHGVGAGRAGRRRIVRLACRRPAAVPGRPGGRRGRDPHRRRRPQPGLSGAGLRSRGTGGARGPGAGPADLGRPARGRRGRRCRHAGPTGLVGGGRGGRRSRRGRSASSRRRCSYPMAWLRWSSGSARRAWWWHPSWRSWPATSGRR